MSMDNQDYLVCFYFYDTMQKLFSLQDCLG